MDTLMQHVENVYNGDAHTGAPVMYHEERIGPVTFCLPEASIDSSESESEVESPIITRSSGKCLRPLDWVLLLVFVIGGSFCLCYYGRLSSSAVSSPISSSSVAAKITHESVVPAMLAATDSQSVGLEKQHDSDSATSSPDSGSHSLWLATLEKYETKVGEIKSIQKEIGGFFESLTSDLNATVQGGQERWNVAKLVNYNPVRPLDAESLLEGKTHLLNSEKDRSRLIKAVENRIATVLDRDLPQAKAQRDLYLSTSNSSNVGESLASVVKRIKEVVFRKVEAKFATTLAQLEETLARSKSSVRQAKQQQQREERKKVQQIRAQKKGVVAAVLGNTLKQAFTVDFSDTASLTKNLQIVFQEHAELEKKFQQMQAEIVQTTQEVVTAVKFPFWLKTSFANVATFPSECEKFVERIPVLVEIRKAMSDHFRLSLASDETSEEVQATMEGLVSSGVLTKPDEVADRLAKVLDETVSQHREAMPAHAVVKVFSRVSTIVFKMVTGVLTSTGKVSWFGMNTTAAVVRAAIKQISRVLSPIGKITKIEHVLGFLSLVVTAYVWHQSAGEINEHMTTENRVGKIVLTLLTAMLRTGFFTSLKNVFSKNIDVVKELTLGCLGTQNGDLFDWSNFDGSGYDGDRCERAMAENFPKLETLVQTNLITYFGYQRETAHAKKFHESSLRVYADRRALGLNVFKTPTVAEIKKAYHKSSLVTHPDKKGGNQKAFDEVQNAKNRLLGKKEAAQPVVVSPATEPAFQDDDTVEESNQDELDVDALLDKFLD